MSIAIPGVVRNGVIVPDSPLPEGTPVEIRPIGKPLEMPPELLAEFAAWQQAGADALELVERLAEEGEADDKG